MPDPLAPPSDGSQLLLIGHRGVGTCEEQELLQKRCTESGIPIPERIMENTVRSMLAAHAAGAHFVEFDVQLSRDRVPIIHHDFYTSDSRFVGDLTLAQLQALNDGATCLPDEHQFATLESLFALLPGELGFDVEIKYPRTYLDGTSLCPEFHWSMADYVSTIVDAVKSDMDASDSARRRPVFYSCFVSEVCLLLRQLHPKCPVVYLVNHKEAHKYTEVRGATGRVALEFAAGAGLQGVAIHSEELLLAPDRDTVGSEFVHECRRRGLRCLTWGPGNNSSKARRLQRAWGVDGVIYDNIHAKEDKMDLSYCCDCVCG